MNLLSESKPFAAGRVEYNDYGARLGIWKVSKHKHVGEISRHGVLNVGPIQVGLRTYYVGVIPGRKDIFLGANGRLWRYPRSTLKSRVNPPPHKPLRRWASHMAMWADTLRSCAVDCMDMMPEYKLGEEGRDRYTSLVRTLVFRCIVDCAAFGIARTPNDMAKCVSPHWTEWDLLRVVVPSVRHALLVSLLLALKEREAADLIELAAFCEYRCTVITRQASTAMYVGAAQQLARLCPEWWTAGYATDWKMHGSIEQRMRRQFMRIVRDANGIDGVEYDVAGVNVREVAELALKHEVVSRDTSQRSLDRREKVKAYAAIRHLRGDEYDDAVAAAQEEHKSVRYGTDDEHGNPTVRVREKPADGDATTSLAIGLLDLSGSAHRNSSQG